MTTCFIILQQPVSTSLPWRQQLVAMILAISILLIILELVRRRKLREEYSVLWVITGVGLLVLSTNYGLLLTITDLIGAVLPTSTLFFGGLMFLICVTLQFSVRLSTTTRRIKDLNQKMALLEQEITELREEREKDDVPKQGS